MINLVDIDKIEGLLNKCDINNTHEGIMGNLKKWEANKRWIFDSIMGGQLTQEFDPMAREDIAKAFEANISFRRSKSYILNQAASQGATHIQKRIGAVIMTKTFLKCLEANRIDGRLSIMLQGDNKLKGMKLSKVISRSYTAHGLDIEISKAIQSMSVKETNKVILSIDPYDYLTMSHGRNWGSCYSLQDDGEYNSGTVGYIVDGSTIIAYAGDTDNKLWRQAIYVSKDSFFFSRPYPGEREIFTNTAVNGLLSLYSDPFYVYDTKKSQTMGYANVCKGNGCYGYLDSSHKYDGMHFGIKEVLYNAGSSADRIIAGGAGNQLDDPNRFIDSETLNGGHECEHCGDFIGIDEGFEIDGYYYCDDCVTYCAGCDDYHVEGEQMEYINGDYYCDGHFDYCNDCGEATLNSKLEDGYCPDCMGECEECGDEHPTCEMNDGVCDKCWNECEECNDYITKSNTYFHDGRKLCEECYNIALEEEQEEAENSA